MSAEINKQINDKKIKSLALLCLDAPPIKSQQLQEVTRYFHHNLGIRSHKFNSINFTSFLPAHVLR